MSHDLLEIIAIYLTQETFLIIINVKNNFAASYFVWKLGLGIENRFRFQNRILKVRNRILVVKLKFRFRLSNPMRLFFFICVDRTYSDLPGPCSLVSAPKFGYSCDQKPKKLSIISVIAKHVAREVSPPT